MSNRKLCSRLLSLSVLLTCALLTGLAIAAPVPKPSAEQVRLQLDELWTDLRRDDERIAGLALLKMGARPGQTVGYLREKLRPLTLETKEAERLLRQLGDDDERVSAAAYDRLSYLDPRLALDVGKLREALIDRPESAR